MAFERTKTIPRRPATIDLVAMTGAAGADTVEKVVDHFAHRFLSVPLAARDRAVLVTFLRDRLGSTSIRTGIQAGDKLEDALRELLYVLLSMPGYQVG